MFPVSAYSPGAADGLRAALRSVTIQELRSAARLWGWPIKGTAKADIIEALAQHLNNAQEMQTNFRTLSATQQQVTIWLAHLSGPDESDEMLRAVIAAAEGRDLSQTTIKRAISELRQRLIVFADSYQGLYVPAAYREWLPCSEAPAMVYRGLPTPGGRPAILPTLGLDELDQHVEQLLMLVERQRPIAVQPPAPASARAPVFQQATDAALTIQPHTGIVSNALLTQWGYTGVEEQHLARTLLSLLLEGGLCRLQSDGRLQLIADQVAMWRDLPAEARLTNLRTWWTRHAPAGVFGAPPPIQLIWDELDMVLTGQTTYSLRQKVSWATRDRLDNQIKQLRAWLLRLLHGFQEGVWFSFARLLDLIRRLRRDPLLWTAYEISWTWYEGETPLGAAQMSQRVWNETFGALIEACLSGPASWLGLVQVAVEDNAIVAFMRPVVGAGETAALAADTLRFLPDGRLILRNSWRAGDLRQTIRQVATEVARDRETTTYTLSAEAFRRALQDGQGAEQIIAAFAAAGFPLPAGHADRLRDWQARVGRYQIYDHLGVIEFADDETLAEVQATIGLNRSDFYPISSRCLIVLRPETMPELLDELRRKGYTPQVIS